MKQVNTLANPNAQEKKVKFSVAITSDSMQRMIQKSVPDARAAARLTGTLISIVNSNEELQQCDYTSIVSAALRGEGMGLVLGHGYYVVPYKGTAAYQIGYKGYIQLALSTRFYADMDCIDVREGEVKGLNPRTCKPTIDFSTYGSVEEREKHRIVGYYAYFELKDGMFYYLYWNVDKILKHADQYSPAFSLKKYNAMMDGSMKPDEIGKLKKGSAWYDVGAGQDRMMRKTVLRQLLNSGYAPLSNEVRYIIENDDDEGLIPNTAVADENFIPTTGEVVDVEKDAPASDSKAPVSEDSREGKETPAKTASRSRGTAAGQESEEQDFTNGFFD